jgi:hypothetical protein
MMASPDEFLREKGQKRLTMNRRGAEGPKNEKGRIPIFLIFGVSGVYIFIVGQND